MKRTTKYVALDVHQATTVASVREEGGRVIARSVFPTEGGVITEFLRGMPGAVHVTFEEGTQAQWLHDVIAPLVDRTVVCDRRGETRPGNKGDHVDADHLSELLRRGGLRAVYHGSAHRGTLKELTRAYRNVAEDATRVMLRLKALFRARGVVTVGPLTADIRLHRSAGMNCTLGYPACGVEVAPRQVATLVWPPTGRDRCTDGIPSCSSSTTSTVDCPRPPSRGSWASAAASFITGWPPASTIGT